jgi:hypothetical protein
MTASPQELQRLRSPRTPAEAEMERQRIRDAMDRLLDGKPLYSDGKLTVKSLAAEAQVKRWLLTHKHVDLQDEFRARVDHQGRTPQALQSSLDQIAVLSARVQSMSEKLAVERETVKCLERVVRVLTTECEHLRQGSSDVTNIRSIKRSTH